MSSCTLKKISLGGTNTRIQDANGKFIARSEIAPDTLRALDATYEQEVRQVKLAAEKVAAEKQAEKIQATTELLTGGTLTCGADRKKKTRSQKDAVCHQKGQVLNRQGTACRARRDGSRSRSPSPSTLSYRPRRSVGFYDAAEIPSVPSAALPPTSECERLMCERNIRSYDDWKDYQKKFHPMAHKGGISPDAQYGTWAACDKNQRCEAPVSNCEQLMCERNIQSLDEWQKYRKEKHPLANKDGISPDPNFADWSVCPKENRCPRKQTAVVVAAPQPQAENRCQTLMCNRDIRTPADLKAWQVKNHPQRNAGVSPDPMFAEVNGCKNVYCPLDVSKLSAEEKVRKTIALLPLMIQHVSDDAKAKKILTQTLETTKDELSSMTGIPKAPTPMLPSLPVPKSTQDKIVQAVKASVVAKDLAALAPTVDHGALYTMFVRKSDQERAELVQQVEEERLKMEKSAAEAAQKLQMAQAEKEAREKEALVKSQQAQQAVAEKNAEQARIAQEKASANLQAAAAKEQKELEQQQAKLAAEQQRLQLEALKVAEVEAAKAEELLKAGLKVAEEQKQAQAAAEALALVTEQTEEEVKDLVQAQEQSNPYEWGTLFNLQHYADQFKNCQLISKPDRVLLDKMFLEGRLDKDTNIQDTSTIPAHFPGYVGGSFSIKTAAQKGYKVTAGLLGAVPETYENIFVEWKIDKPADLWVTTVRSPSASVPPLPLSAEGKAAILASFCYDQVPNLKVNVQS